MGGKESGKNILSYILGTCSKEGRVEKFLLGLAVQLFLLTAFGFHACGVPADVSGVPIGVSCAAVHADA